MPNQRGDVILCRLPMPSTGLAQLKLRPAVVVSKDVNNRRLDDVVVAPCTSNVSRRQEPTQYLIAGTEIVTKISARMPPPLGVGRKRRPPSHQSVFLALVVLLLYNANMRTDVPFKSNRNGVYSCKYHVVWCPKYRRSVLVNTVDTRLKEIIQQTAAELHADVLELEVMPDHVHLLCEVDPQFGIHTLVKRLKGRSSRLLRQEFPWLRSRLPTLWTNSYPSASLRTGFVATVGGAPLAVIKQYVENQKHT